METVLKWYQNSGDAYSMSVEKFAKMVQEYLEQKGDDHRVIFLVDEVGQYIGQDTKLMLNLQTIAEDLGRICKGRSWVIVTSQEDMDAILGDMPGARANDFSKIMGRFTTRISLSSSNTDEVIRTRLLEKTDKARKELEVIYDEKQDILRNQISFTSDCATMKSFDVEEDFVASYPFVPYQFNLLQKVFEAIRKVGATGTHLAKGERSMLDSFQVAAKAMQESGPEILIPFYDFYPAVAPEHDLWPDMTQVFDDEAEFDQRRGVGHAESDDLLVFLVKHRAELRLHGFVRFDRPGVGSNRNRNQSLRNEREIIG